jgi:hypothetical protein
MQIVTNITATKQNNNINYSLKNLPLSGNTGRPMTENGVACS